MASGNGYFASTGNSDKLSFTTDITTTCTTANLSQARETLAGCSSSINGYFAGGWGTDITDKLVFATDITATQTSANLSLARWGLAAVHSSDVFPRFSIHSNYFLTFGGVATNFQ